MADGMLHVDELERLVTAGDVDTVLVAFPDLYGRLVGKRVMGGFFLDHVLDDGIEACSYLLGVDVQTTRDEYLIRQIRNGMQAAGVPVEFSKGEAGRGQHEINLRYADALEMADRHVIYKNGAKEIADLNGRAITFMAKYSMDESGSSCHVHSSVWDADGTTSLMWSDDAPDHLSPAFRGWLGGLVAHSGELAWLFAPTVNS